MVQWLRWPSSCVLSLDINVPVIDWHTSWPISQTTEQNEQVEVMGGMDGYWCGSLGMWTQWEKADRRENFQSKQMSGLQLIHHLVSAITPMWHRCSMTVRCGHPYTHTHMYYRGAPFDFSCHALTCKHAHMHTQTTTTDLIAQRLTLLTEWHGLCSLFAILAAVVHIGPWNITLHVCSSPLGSQMFSKTLYVRFISKTKHDLTPQILNRPLSCVI